MEKEEGEEFRELLLEKKSLFGAIRRGLESVRWTGTRGMASKGGLCMGLSNKERGGAGLRGGN